MYKNSEIACARGARRDLVADLTATDVHVVIAKKWEDPASLRPRVLRAEWWVWFRDCSRGDEWTKNAGLSGRVLDQREAALPIDGSS